MKKNYLISIALLFFGIINAQEAQKNFINYQGVARNAENQLMAGENMVLGIDLKIGSPVATPTYSENHSITTDTNGVFSLKIGNGNTTSGDYNSIPWGSGATFVTVSINGSEIGTTEMMAVPYALSSGDASQSAAEVPYDNSATGLSAANTQEAIDALAGGGTIDTDDQGLVLTGDILTIQDGSGSVDLSSYVDDEDADSNNELQTLSFDPGTNELSLSDGNSVIIPSGGTDADADPTNELQNLSFDAGTNELSLSDGNSVTIPSGGTDADADPTNEFQTLSFDSGTNELSLSDGNSVTIPSGGTDADADPTNELQDISLVGTELTISDGSTIDLAPIVPPGGSDDQNLELIGDVLSIESGAGSVDLGDYIDDNDADPNNELQNLSFNATTNELSLTFGNSVTIPSGGTDADADPTNEIQTLSFDSGTNELSLTDGGVVTLPSGGSGLTLPYYGEVSEAGAAFHAHNYDGATYGVVGSTGTDGATIPNNTAGVLGYSTSGHGVYGYAENSFLAGVQGVSNSATGHGVLGYGLGGGIGGFFYTTPAGRAALSTGVGNVGIGTQDPTAKMHVVHDSFVGTPQLKLEETGDDYARIELSNDQVNSFWNIAGLTKSTSNESKLNFYYHDGAVGQDRMTILGNGNVGVNNSNPVAKLDVGGNIRSTDLIGTGQRNVVADANGNLVIGSGSSGSSLWQENGSNIYYDGGNAGLGTDLPDGKLHIKSDSGIFTPQLALEEEGNDYARLEFQNDQSNAFWHIAGLANGDGDTDKINFYYDTGSSGTNWMTLLANGNLGIGNDSPAAKLDILGGNWDPGSTEGDFRIGNPSHRLKIGVATTGAGAGDVRIRAEGGTDRMILGGGSNDILTVTDQFVGIGTLSPSASLDVEGGIRSSTLAGAGGNVVADANGNLVIGSGGGGGSLWSQAGTDINYTAGNVGIGVFVPTGRTEIAANSTTSFPQLVLNEDQDDYARLAFKNTFHAGAQWHIAGTARNGATGAASSKLNFWFANDLGAADRMTITGDGNVGIGTVNPTTKLDVNGDINTNGEVHSAATGTANMIPIAYGTVDINGVILNGSGNFTVSGDTGSYRIILIGAEGTFSTNTHTASVSLAGVVSGTGQPGFISYYQGTPDNNLAITTYNFTGFPQDIPFSFVVYKP